MLLKTSDACTVQGQTREEDLGKLPSKLAGRAIENFRIYRGASLLRKVGLHNVMYDVQRNPPMRREFSVFAAGFVQLSTTTWQIEQTYSFCLDQALGSCKR